MFDYTPPVNNNIPAEVQLKGCPDGTTGSTCDRRKRGKQLVVIQLSSPELNQDDLDNGHVVPRYVIESNPVELKDYWDRYDIAGVAIRDSLEYRHQNNINWADCYDWQLTLIPLGNNGKQDIW